MTKNWFKNISLLKSIGWLQIVGGIFGLVSICNSLLQTGVINGSLLLIFLCSIGVFVFSIYAGKSLLYSKNEDSKSRTSFYYHLPVSNYGRGDQTERNSDGSLFRNERETNTFQTYLFFIKK